MIAGVADDVHERIVQQINNRAIEFGFFALGTELDLPARLVCDVTRYTGHLLKGALDRDQSKCHRSLLEIPHDLGDVRDVPLHALVLER